jgi:hypothetical protein
VPFAYFYEDMPDKLQNTLRSAKPLAGETTEGDIMLTRETLELVRPYYQIESGNIRTSIRKLLKAMAAESWKS